MLLDIWFPQIVIVIGGVGALLCFAMVFAPTEKEEDHHHHSDHGTH